MIWVVVYKTVCILFSLPFIRDLILILCISFIDMYISTLRLMPNNPTGPNINSVQVSCNGLLI